MGEREERVEQTQHAFLVAWGQFGHAIGLVSGLQEVKLNQKKYRHTPQAKVLEFLVGILSGMKQLQDISLAAHPLDKDAVVAEAWGQPGWADYSGVSRTLSGLSWEEAYAIASVLEQVSQPFLDAELKVIRNQGGRVRIDGDLTGIPVSNTSRTYPNAAFGHMDDEVRLGYQAGVVSLVSPTYGCLWLSGTHHPGDTVSSTQAESLILAAEAGMGLRPKRRTQLLEGRIGDQAKNLEAVGERLKKQQEAYWAAQHRWQQAQKEAAQQLKVLESTELLYQSKGRQEANHWARKSRTKAKAAARLPA